MSEHVNDDAQTASAPLYAAIDIGTVTCRLMVARCSQGKLDIQARRSSFVHLGEDVDKTGVLKPEAIARTDEKVGEYLQIIDEVSAGETVILTAIATSASRDAANSDEFVTALAKRGVQLSIVSGQREAAFCFAGATADYAGERVLVVDTGGGSTELIAGIGGQTPQYAHSFQIGCRRATERFFHTDPPTADELDASYTWMKPQFATFFDQLGNEGFKPERIIAVAGTATSLVSIDQELEPYDPALVHGTVLTVETLQRIATRLASLPVEQRKEVIGLQPQRAELIVAGAQILQTVMEISGKSEFTVSESDLLEGIILLTAAERTSFAS